MNQIAHCSSGFSNQLPVQGPRQGVGSCSFVLLWKEDFSFKSKNKDKYKSKNNKSSPKTAKTSSKSTQAGKQRQKQGFSKEDGQTTTDALSTPQESWWFRRWRPFPFPSFRSLGFRHWWYRFGFRLIRFGTGFFWFCVRYVYEWWFLGRRWSGSTFRFPGSSPKHQCAI